MWPVLATVWRTSGWVVIDIIILVTKPSTWFHLLPPFSLGPVGLSGLSRKPRGAHPPESSKGQDIRGVQGTTNRLEFPDSAGRPQNG